jgi:membrane protease YdiL (CAAX protease family)
MSPSNRDLLLPYALPYFAYVGLDLLLREPLGAEGVYAARLICVPGLLAWGWSRYQRIRGPGSPLGSIALGALGGLIGWALWVGLAWPFADPAAEAWADGPWAWRLVGSVLLPPVFEELLMRGWVLGVILAWDQARRAGATEPMQVALDERSVLDLQPGSWSPWALLGSSALFAVGHAPAHWPAAFAYGLLMCALWIARRDLLSCMAAHAVTNAVLALHVRATGAWGLW